MPRANRYIVPGNIYHLTHRCHDRRFLLKFACDRHGYRRRLREAVIQAGLPLLDYNITSNQPKWTEGLAVGSQSFVERLKQQVRNRQETETTVEDGAWILRENYGSIFWVENRSISITPFGATFFA